MASIEATAEEIGRAKGIKEAALEAGLDPISDFEYLQHAIVAKDKVSKAVKRLEKLQKFREQYNVTDAEKDDALNILRGSYALFPGMLGAIGKDEDGVGVQLSVVRNYLPNSLKSEDWRTVLVAGYYMFNALNSDIESMRKGMVFISDCGGMGWKNFSLKAQKKNAEIFQDAYAIRINKMVLLDAPFVMAAMLKLIRAILSKKMKETIVIDKTETFFESGQLPKELTPPKYGGTASDDEAFKFLEEKLALRTKNEKEFSL